MGVAGAGSLAKVINAAMGNSARFDAMRDFFDGVGTGHAAGVWQDVPQRRATSPGDRGQARPTMPIGEMA